MSEILEKVNEEDDKKYLLVQEIVLKNVTKSVKDSPLYNLIYNSYNNRYYKKDNINTKFYPFFKKDKIIQDNEIILTEIFSHKKQDIDNYIINISTVVDNDDENHNEDKIKNIILNKFNDIHLNEIKLHNFTEKDYPIVYYLIGIMKNEDIDIENFVHKKIKIIDNTYDMLNINNIFYIKNKEINDNVLFFSIDYLSNRKEIILKELKYIVKNKIKNII